MADNKDNRDYDYVVGKLPRKNKDGKDISDDKIGKGGRRREDGTISSMAYDLKVVDENPLEKQNQPQPPRRVQREYYEEPRRTRYEDLTPGQRFAVDLTGALVDRVLDYAEYKITEGIDNWLENRKRKKEEERIAARKEYVRQRKAADEKNKNNKKAAETRISSGVEVVDSSEIIDAIPEEFGDAYKQYSVNMTSEEAQKELIDAFILYVLSAKKVWKVSHANIIDSAGNITQGKEMIAKLSNPQLLKSINTILEKNPSLLDEWQTLALAGILGRDVVNNAVYVPIGRDDLKKALMVNE